MSDTARKTLRNTALLVAFQVANPLLSLVLVGTLSRKLGAEGLGAYNLLLNFFFVAHSLTSLGLNTLITREVSRDRTRAAGYLCSSACMGLVVSVLAGVGLAAVVRLSGLGADVERVGWLVALALLPSIVILYSEAVFVAFERIEFIVSLALVENVGKVAVGLWLVHHGFGVTALIASLVSFRCLTLMLNLILFHRVLQPIRWSLDPDLIRTLVRGVPVFGGILVASTLYWGSDVFFLAKLGSLAAVGYYTAAYRLFSISQIVPKSFDTAVYPVFSRLFHRSPDLFQKANSLSIRYVLVVLLPIAAGVHGLAGPIVRGLFGEDFGPAVPALRILIWVLVPYGIVRVLASRMFASNRQRLDLQVNLVGLATNAALNLALIPRFGLLGCAWATLLSIVLFLGYQCFVLRREIFPVLRQAEVLRPALAASLLAAWLHWTSPLTLWIQVPVAVLIYAASILLLGVIPWRELKLILPQRFVAVRQGGRDP